MAAEVSKPSEIHCTNFEDDIVAFNEFVVRNSPSVRRRFIVQLVFPSLVLVVAGLVLMTPSVIPRIAQVPVIGYALLIGAAVHLSLFPWRFHSATRRAVRALMREGKNLCLYGPQRVVLTPQDVARYTQFGHAAWYWSAIERIEATDRHLFIFVTASSAFLVPRRDFAGDAEFQAFVETARRFHRAAEAPPQIVMAPPSSPIPFV